MPSRSRSSRSVPATALPDVWEPVDGRVEAVIDDDAAPSPAPNASLAELVDSAIEAGHVERDAIAAALEVEGAALATFLDEPSRLGRTQRDALADALGIARAVVRAACGAGSPTRHVVVPNDRRALGELPEARPRSLAELLERTVAAVADDALGRRVRLSLLTTVQTAAAEAGRDVPPGVHGLRGRVLRGELAWIGDGAVVVNDDGAPADHLLLDAVEGAIRAAQRHAGLGGGYDDLFAPLHDDALHALLRALTTAVRLTSLGETSECVVTPPLFGRHLALCSADASIDQRRVAMRRAAAHVLCGHVGEFTPLPLPAPPLVARTADVFALADLVPFWQVHEWRRRGRLGWRATMREATRMASMLAPDWDAVRADDAGRLRVLLYRERGL